MLRQELLLLTRGIREIGCSLEVCKDNLQIIGHHFLRFEPPVPLASFRDYAQNMLSNRSRPEFLIT